MGQYYHPISIEKKQWLSAHDYDNGLKLMEHSYIGNNFVRAVESLLLPGGAWYKTKIVWAGDYADAEKGTVSENNLEGENLYQIIGVDENKIKPEVIDRPKNETGKSNYFLVNHTAMQFIDMSKIKEMSGDIMGWKIHPLPLLTCEGNGRGGGGF